MAEAGSFSRAAERFDVSQSHLSRQIMRLEAAFGHRLFVRRARHVELTDAGQILRQETNFLSLRLDSLPERMSEAAGGFTASLCIGFTIDGCLNPMAAKVIRKLGQEEPQLSLRFSVEPRACLIEAIVERRVQAGFLRPPAACSREIRVDCLAKEPILVAVDRAHRLAGREQVELTEIADEPLSPMRKEIGTRDLRSNNEGLSDGWILPRVTFHAPQPTIALLLASAGIGVALIPASWRSVHAEFLHFASVARGILSTSLALITRADEHLAGVRVLRKHALAAAALQGGSAVP